VSFTTIEAAARAKVESKSIPFKDSTLYVNYFESKSVRQAHTEELKDKAEFERYRKLI
jgi:hypothetical protein